jgi:putative Mn2+ efflux pump MntP
MGLANTILIICGAIVSLFGIATFLNPNFARWINAPGGPRLKATISLIAGIIIIIIGLTIEIQQA